MSYKEWDEMLSEPRPPLFRKGDELLLPDEWSKRADQLPGVLIKAEPAWDPKFRLMIARFPGGNSEHPDSSGWVMETLLKAKADHRIAEVLPWRKSDTPITMVRNACVRDALAANVDYLLMIDSDMSPDLPGGQAFWGTSWEFLVRRREHEYLLRRQGVDEVRIPPPATIAAPYCGPPPHENVFVFEWADSQSDHPGPDFRLEQVSRAAAAIRVGIQEVAALPTGLILYDMRVFKALDTPWFEYEYTDAMRSAKSTTEDVYQTRNASLLGLPQFVNWDAWAGHVKLKTVGRPAVLTVDDVHSQLAQHVAMGLRRGEGLRFVRDES